MSRHVAAHKWADALAGKLAARDVAAMELHAESCASCARARARVTGASASFPALREQSAPELSWDTIRARVHWAVSSEKRAKQRSPRSKWLVLAGVGAAAAAVTTIALVSGPATPASPSRTEPVAVPAPTKRAPEQLGAVVVRESGQRVMVDGVLREQTFDNVFGAGVAFATAAGRIDLQFGEASALAIGSNSIVAFARLDSERIELVLREGTLDVTVAKRAPEQTFVVHVGSPRDPQRSIEVRGTQFRVVEHAGALRVECAHGRVAVRDAAGEVEVAAAQKLAVPARGLVTSAATQPLTGAELAVLAAEQPLTLPVWTTPAQLVQTSAPLEVATTGPRHVRVDGLEVGTGPLRLRVMPGRHTVEAADDAGRFRRAGWVDVAAKSPARVAILPDAPPQAAVTSGESARRKQLRAGMDRARLAQCTRSIAKAGVTDTYVRIEISIDATGAIQFLNVIDTDLPSTTASCVRDVLADVRFKAGASATFRDKIDL